ncbi:hypothetical protein [Loktanella sp. SALINAS62]|uniref:hypothetical protein n=1 Tax=Loktanella sp. SALINAS62 TaxID=2706124 RepID=UPI001B8BF60B|nr:hypothetical protein [Loktanella sp. SALINAS62]MBS1300931.1 hypothetical protein [Loktanella sp. SALINAS62]
MKYVLTLTVIAAAAASPALAHGDTPIHADSPVSLIAGVAVLGCAMALAYVRRRPG